MLSELLYFTNCIVNLVKCIHLKPYTNKQIFYLGLVLQIFLLYIYYCTINGTFLDMGTYWIALNGFI